MWTACYILCSLEGRGKREKGLEEGSEHQGHPFIMGKQSENGKGGWVVFLRCSHTWPENLTLISLTIVRGQLSSNIYVHVKVNVLLTGIS